MPWAPSSSTWSPRARASWTSHVASVDVGREPLAPGERLLDEVVDLEAGLGAEVRPGAAFFSGRMPLELQAQRRLVEEILHADADPPGAILVGRADPPPRRADLRARRGESRAAPSSATWYGMITCAAKLTRTVTASIPRTASMPARRCSVRRIDDDPAADDRHDMRVEDARGDEVELEDLVADHDGVAGVVAALVADDERDLLGEEVGGLALALVAPLETDDDRRRHQARLSSRDRGP